MNQTKGTSGRIFELFRSSAELASLPFFINVCPMQGGYGGGGGGSMRDNADNYYAYNRTSGGGGGGGGSSGRGKTPGWAWFLIIVALLYMVITGGKH